MVNLITNIPDDIKIETSYNFITEIPQDIKLELSNGTLTLKSGSVITNPDGTQLQTGVDNSVTISTNGVYIIFAVANSGSISTYSAEGVIKSGSSLPESGTFGSIFYNTSDNKIYIYTTQWNIWSVSFPIAKVTVSNGAISSIDQVFNGVGYIGHHAFVLPGIKGVYPNGSLNQSFTTNSLAIREMSIGQLVTGIDRAIATNAVWGGYKEVNKYADADFTKGWIRYYVKADNKIYTYNGSSVIQENSTPLLFYNYDGTSVTKFEINDKPVEGVLIIKAGSILTKPDGTQSQTVNDIFPSPLTTMNDVRIVFTNGINYITAVQLNSVICSPTAPTIASLIWFNTTNNKFYTGGVGNWAVSNLFLPVAIITVSDGVVVSIDKVFNGFGYFGNPNLSKTLFALPKVRGLILEGRDIDGNPKYREITNNALIIRNNYNGEYASLMAYNDNYYGIELSEKPVYSDVANIFVKQPNITPFYYDFNFFDMNLESKELDCSIIGLSQYANSPKFETLRKELVDIFNQVSTIQSFYDYVFNLKTATGYGLDIWGGILDQDRYFTYYNYGTNQYEVVYLKGGQTVDGIIYSDEEIENMYRLILFLKAMSYISNASIAKLNEMLQFYFEGRGLAYVYEYGTMKIRYVFRFYLSNLEKAIFESDLMPNPTGVLVDFEYLPKGAYFGFFVNGKVATDQPYAPMDQKPFYW